MRQTQRQRGLLATAAPRIVTAKACDGATGRDTMRVEIRWLLCASVVAAIGFAGSTSPAKAQDCKNRGQLDTLY